MKKLFLVALIALVLLFAGCTAQQSNSSTGTTTNNVSGGQTTNQSQNSTVTPTNWCTPGASWTYSGTGVQGGQASWTIKGFENYKGSTYCHATYTINTEGQNMIIEAYFTENGKDVWVVYKDAQGNVIQEMHSSQPS